MQRWFLNRGCNTNTIIEAYTKAKKLRRKDLLQHKQKEPEEQQNVNLVTRYNTGANKI